MKKIFTILLVAGLSISSIGSFAETPRHLEEPVLSEKNIIINGGPINEYYWVVSSVIHQGVNTSPTRTLVHQSSPAKYDGENHSFSVSVSRNHSFSGTISVNTGALNSAIGYTYNASVSYQPGNSISVKKGQYVMFYTRDAYEIRQVNQKQMNYNTLHGTTTETGNTSSATCYKALAPSIEMDVYNAYGGRSQTYIFEAGPNGYHLQPKVINYEK